MKYPVVSINNRDSKLIHVITTINEDNILIPINNLHHHMVNLLT
ncbi:hypothetical protein HOR18_gp088 [Staphylococcus phage vB_SscM-1]|uniref:Uncharacterized protein n=2 Tax=Sciuriunavirus SscM1 TaxID=2734053 RepID=A0A1X9I9Q2_9CAUD|nr:hypothetical protein HOR18_gp088 [Staphylococcus phage vB_SscM-1]ANT44751.1 hypothetical protein vB_SscM-1_087 [Staphylococcus phage vB_SscM-1]ANT44953.1 hypothetical protein vB_SscM-2_086 [Staphylococcus phage vB_SscM-2]